MRNSSIICVWGLVILSVVPSLQADGRDKILGQKKELEQLRQDVEEGRRRLDSLQREEQRIQKHLSGHEQKIASDRKVIRRLSKELDQLQNDIAHGDSQLVANQQLNDLRNRRYLGNIRQFYMVSQQPAIVLSDQPNEELELDRKIIYLSALADFESVNVEEASGHLNQSVEELNELHGKHKTISGLKKKRETSYALGTSQKLKKQKNLDQLRRKSMVEADHVITLEKAAEEMAAIIARLEEQRARAMRGQVGQPGPSVFAGLKGQLLPPCRGKVVLGFGDQVDSITRLKSFSPGIVVKGRPGAPVYAVASGTVAYAGNLRGYGNFVIINHDHQYYTTYAGLEKIVVTQDQFVQVRTQVGTSSDDGLVRFELRRGHDPLDPVEWIRIESL